MPALRALAIPALRLAWILKAEPKCQRKRRCCMSQSIPIAPPPSPRTRVRNSIGVELWLNTPIPGLRIGAGGIRYDVLPPDGNRWTTYHISAEGEFGRVVAHVEYKNINFGQGTYEGGYGHLGFKVTDKITVNVQRDFANLNVN